MPTPSYNLPTAAQWEEVLTFRDLPIMAETRDALRRALKDPQVSFDALVPVTEADPALCWHLLQAAAGQNPDCREQLKGAYSCLSLLGMQELVRLVKKLPVVRDSDGERARHYRQALITAHMAGCLAAQWSTARGQQAPQAYWVAMLSHSIIWPWLLMADDSKNWLHRLSEGDDLLTASMAVFGDNRQNWLRLARRHHLPDAVMDIFRPETFPDTAGWRSLRRDDPRMLDDGRRLIHQSQSPAMLAVTAAGTAWQLHLAPEGRRADRWLALSSNTQGRQLQQIQQECRAVQLEETRLRKDGNVSGLRLLASPEPTSQHYPEYIPEAESRKAETKTIPSVKKETTAAKIESLAPEASESKEPAAIEKTPPVSPQVDVPAAPVQHGDAYLKKLLDQLTDQPDSFGDWHYLMRGVLRGITTGIGIQHACIMLPDKGRERMRIVYSENPDGLETLAQVKIVLNSAPLFRQLMKQSAAVNLTPDNRASYLRGMPASVVDALPANMMLMSISAGGAPIGLVLAIPGEGAASPTPQQYQSFKRLCSVTSKGLVSLRRLSAGQGDQRRRSSQA